MHTIKDIIVFAVCPVCGKGYRYRKEYFMKNKTCPSRECKGKYQEESVKTMRNLIGELFGDLEVIEFCWHDKHNHPIFLCKCDCGEFIDVPAYRLLNGSVKNCGCSEEKQKGIIPAKMVCPFQACPHHMLHEQIFQTKSEMVVNDFIREAGGCMLEISPEEEQAGMCGMRRGCSQEELAEVFGVYLFTVQSAEYKALKTLQERMENPL
jgi:hypothetical protein